MPKWGMLCIGVVLLSACQTRHYGTISNAATKGGIENFTRNLPYSDPEKEMSAVKRHFEASYPEDKGYTETLVFNQGARVVLVDYELMKRDFPVLTEFTHARIDEFILENAAWMSLGQVREGVIARVMTQGNFDPSKTREGFRPPLYNRAVLTPVATAGSPVTGLFDLKGAGSRSPHNSRFGHSNGLAGLGEAIREFAHEKMLARIFSDLGGVHSTVGVYAVLDLGFQIIDEKGQIFPAGLIVRQAHLRTYESEYATRLPSASFDQATGELNDSLARKGWDLEYVLRMFGFSSAFRRELMTPLGEKRVMDLVNVQFDTRGRLIDIGTVSRRVQEQPFPLWHPSWGASELLEPSDLAYPMPEPALRFPDRFEPYAVAEAFVAPKTFVGETGKALRTDLSRTAVENLLTQELFEPADAHMDNLAMAGFFSPTGECQTAQRHCQALAGFTCDSGVSRTPLTIQEGERFQVCVKVKKANSRDVNLLREYNLQFDDGRKCILSETHLMQQLDFGARPNCEVQKTMD